MNLESSTKIFFTNKQNNKNYKKSITKTGKNYKNLIIMQYKNINTKLKKIKKN